MLIQGNSIELLEKDESIAALKGKVNFIVDISATSIKI